MGRRRRRLRMAPGCLGCGVAQLLAVQATQPTSMVPSVAPDDGAGLPGRRARVTQLPIVAMAQPTSVVLAVAPDDGTDPGRRHQAPSGLTWSTRTIQFSISSCLLYTSDAADE